MYYFEKQGNIINKYDIKYNSGELEKINYEIINNYSTITHKETQGTTEPYYDGNILEFRNIKSAKIVPKKGDYKNVYLFTYDEYVYPRISIEIKKLLNGDITAAKKIFEYEEEKEYLKSKLSELTSSFNSTDKKDYDDPLDYLESQINELTNLKCSIDSLNYNLKEIANDYTLKGL